MADSSPPSPATYQTIMSSDPLPSVTSFPLSHFDGPDYFLDAIGGQAQPPVTQLTPPSPHCHAFPMAYDVA